MHSSMRNSTRQQERPTGDRTMQRWEEQGQSRAETEDWELLLEPEVLEEERRGGLPLCDKYQIDALAEETGLEMQKARRKGKEELKSIRKVVFETPGNGDEIFLGEIRRGVFTVSKETVNVVREGQGEEVCGDSAPVSVSGLIAPWIVLFLFMIFRRWKRAVKKKREM